nr:sugar nucleotide-binding protein [uncultured Eubacterium sp.]
MGQGVGANALADMGICENNPEESYFANVQVPMYLAKAAKERKLICFSSDQVYSGCDDDGPYAEENVKPANVYATHKLEMEQRVLDIEPSAVMLRAEWMYDMETTKDNYFTLLNKEKAVYFSSQEFRGITYLKEVAENMEKNSVMHLPE